VKNVIIKERRIKMCMKYISEIEKKQEIGWKVVDVYGNENIIRTPFEKTTLVIDEQYLANGRYSEGIYIFLNKIFAKRYLIENICSIRKRKRALLKVKLGTHIWKGLSDSVIWKKQNNHFYTTDSIIPLETEIFD